MALFMSNLLSFCLLSYISFLPRTLCKIYCETVGTSYPVSMFVFPAGTAADSIRPSGANVS